MTPCILQNDLLRPLYGAAAFIGALEQRFRLVRYDGRGTGQSTRGVSENTTQEDILRDLLAVVDRLRLTNFVLYGDVFSTYVILRAALELDQAVRACVLVNPVPLNGESFMAWAESMYTHSWELFTNTFATTYGEDGMTGEPMRRVVTHEDYVRLSRSARGYHLKDVLSKVKTPTLVLGPRNQLNPANAQVAQEIGSTIPDSRLVLFEGHRNSDFLSAPAGRLPPAIPVIEDFLATLPSSRPSQPEEPHGGRYARLSRRELAVLRLLAAGRSNQQIADELVITLSTVAKHVTSILAKTESANRTEAAAYAHKHGLL
jgi:DNA-binding CsgD family transcriptional regulator/pimeloyl-ACP methyl ester carboxylesterase